MSEIQNHYESEADEGLRLTAGPGLLELARTQEILRRHLPGGVLRVLDVGGGAGIHASWLAGDGHTVVLVDPVPRHVSQVRSLGIAASLGDARSLGFPDASFDAVLVLGPLYHLVSRSDRVQALREARRVVRPGGWVFVAAISRFASLIDGVHRGFLFEPSFRSIVARDLAEGQHRNPTHRPHWFTTAYFHHPAELPLEAEEAGLDVVELLGVEGPAAWSRDAFSRWSDPAARETLLYSARAVESEPTLLGLSPHLLMVTRR